MHGEFLLVGGGLLDFALVVFLVLPRPQCQLAGLASPRDFVLVVAIFMFLTARNHDFLSGDSTLCSQDLSFVCVGFI